MRACCGNSAMSSRRRIDHEPGYVLHTYSYKETSLIIEAFSRRFGRVALLARGARRPRSAMRGLLLAFYPLRLSWSASSELGTLVGAEWSGDWSAGRRPLEGRGLMCGFYLNELVLRLLPRDDPHEALFDFYNASLSQLCQPARQASTLRAFEKRLLGELGYAPLLERDSASRPIEPDRFYAYEADRGPVLASGSRSGELRVSGRTLLDLAHDDYERPETRDEARLLMRALIGERLHGQVLHTRTVLMELNAL
jgi:DNA repair protein RecO (recombination protein O)